jgi:hypothetical protein
LCHPHPHPQEQINVSQHHQVAQSSGWSQKMEKTMGDLQHLLKSSNDLEMSETRSSDFRYVDCFVFRDD